MDTLKRAWDSPQRIYLYPAGLLAQVGVIAACGGSLQSIYPTVFYAAAATVSFATLVEGTDMLARSARKQGRAEGIAEGESKGEAKGQRNTLHRLNGWREKCIEASAKGEDPPPLPEWAREGMNDPDEHTDDA